MTAITRDDIARLRALAEASLLRGREPVTEHARLAGMEALGQSGDSVLALLDAWEAGEEARRERDELRAFRDDAMSAWRRRGDFGYPPSMDVACEMEDERTRAADAAGGEG